MSYSRYLCESFLHRNEYPWVNPGEYIQMTLGPDLKCNLTGRSLRDKNTIHFDDGQTIVISASLNISNVKINDREIPYLQIELGQRARCILYGAWILTNKFPMTYCNEMHTIYVIDPMRSNVEIGPKHGDGFEYIDELYVEPCGIIREEITHTNPDGSKKKKEKPIEWDPETIRKSKMRMKKFQQEMKRFYETKPEKSNTQKVVEQQVKSKENEQSTRQCTYRKPFSEVIKERVAQFERFKPRELTEEEKKEHELEIKFWQEIESFNTQPSKRFRWFIPNSPKPDDSKKRKRK